MIHSIIEHITSELNDCTKVCTVIYQNRFVAGSRLKLVGQPEQQAIERMVWYVVNREEDRVY